MSGSNPTLKEMGVFGFPLFKDILLLLFYDFYCLDSADFVALEKLGEGTESITFLDGFSPDDLGS